MAAAPPASDEPQSSGAGEAQDSTERASWERASSIASGSTSSGSTSSGSSATASSGSSVSMSDCRTACRELLGGGVRGDRIVSSGPVYEADGAAGGGYELDGLAAGYAPDGVAGGIREPSAILRRTSFRRPGAGRGSWADMGLFPEVRLASGPASRRSIPFLTQAWPDARPPTPSSLRIFTRPGRADRPTVRIDLRGGRSHGCAARHEAPLGGDRSGGDSPAKKEILKCSDSSSAPRAWSGSPG